MRELRSQVQIMSGWGVEQETPEISICCLTYNHEAYIEDALEGFLIQETSFPFEILIYDDASTDNTQAIIAKYEHRYPKIVKAIYQTENQYSKGINVGVEFNLNRANSSYVALCEGDDYWVDPLKLEKQVNFLRKNKEFVITYTDCCAVDVAGNPIKKNFGGAKRDLSQNELIGATPIYTLTSCFRNVFRGKTWPKELLNADYGDLTIWSQLGEFGRGKFLGNIKPSIYRVHSEGLHSSKSEIHQKQMYIQTLFCLYRFWQNAQKTQKAKLVLIKIILSLLEGLSLQDVLVVTAIRYGRASKKIMKSFYSRFCTE